MRQHLSITKTRVKESAAPSVCKKAFLFAVVIQQLQISHGLSDLLETLF